MLRQDTVTSLACLWQTLLNADTSAVSRPRLRAIARQACADARADSLHVERLIILVKTSWATHQNNAAVHDGETWSDRRLRAEGYVSELVSLLIDEYYRRPTDVLLPERQEKLEIRRENPE